MKNFVWTIAGILAIISSANAADTAAIKSACLKGQMEGKTLWVERNQVCIPNNPCKDSNKYGQYCNTIFRDIETQSDGYKALVEIYAKTHNLDCSVVDTDVKKLGQDYVICMGTDVMVFEFDDIRDHRLTMIDPHNDPRLKAICTALEGYYRYEDYIHACYKINDATMCDEASNIISKYNFGFKVGADYEWESYGEWSDEDKAKFSELVTKAGMGLNMCRNLVGVFNGYYYGVTPPKIDETKVDACKELIDFSNAISDYYGNEGSIRHFKSCVFYTEAGYTKRAEF